ncbi:MAG: conserved membrane protein of unknown function [Candidatus Thorarchaeota archaeon]|nr:MAG: conserved membrane protein of unknown function [Candidatus Thorarchaeota archaeon]
MVDVGIIRMGFRNAFRRKRITIFTLVSIMISVGLVYTALSASSNLQANANHFIQESFSPIDLTVEGSYNSPVSQTMMRDIQGYLEVQRAIPRIEEWASNESFGGDVIVYIVAIDMELEQHIGSLNATNGIVDLSSGCFLTHEAEELLNQSVGDILQLHTTSGFFFPKVTGVGFAFDKGVIGPVVFISLQTAWELYPYKYPNNGTNKLLIELHDVFLTEAVSGRITFTYGSDYHITNLKAYPLKIANSFLTQTRAILFGLVLASIFIAGFRVFSSFASIFQKRMHETGIMMAFGADNRTILIALFSEIGLVGFIGSILGCTFGVGFGAFTLNMISQMQTIIFSGPSTSLFSLGFVVDTYSVMISIILGIGLTLFAGYFPALSTTRQSVSKSLSGGNPFSKLITDNKPKKELRLAHLIITIVSSFIIGFVILQLLSDIFHLGIVSEDSIRLAAIPGFLVLFALLSPRISNSSGILKMLTKRSKVVIRYLSSRNSRRNTLSSLVIFNLFCAVTVLFIASTNVGFMVTESWKQNIGYQATSANLVAYMDPPVEMDFLDAVQSYSEVRTAVPMNQDLYHFTSQASSLTGLLLATEPTGFEQLASLAILESVNESAGLDILHISMSCVISDDTALELDVTLGDTIRTHNNYTLSVVGICSSSIAIFVVSVINPLFAIVGTETWSTIQEEDFKIGSLLIESTNPSNTLDTLSDISGVHPVLVSNILADYETALFTVEQMINSSLIALLAVTFASALLSSWSLAASRRREIGMLSAFGMTREEIAKTLTAESTVAFVGGVLAGCVAGYLVQLSISRIIIRITGDLFILISPLVIFLIIFSLIVSILGSYLTVARVTRENVVSLLREESRTD